MSDIEKIVCKAHMVVGDIAYLEIKHGCFEVVNLNNLKETMTIECKTKKNKFKAHNIKMNDEYRYKALYLAEISKSALLRDYD